jgi:hypothetical protein
VSSAIRTHWLPLAVEHADLAGEQRAYAGTQLLLPPGLVEEREREVPAPVGDHDLEQAPLAVTHPAVGDRGDFGQDGDVLVQAQLVQVGQLAALGVPPRVMPQQVTDRMQVERAGEHLRGAVADQRAQRCVHAVVRR